MPLSSVEAHDSPSPIVSHLPVDLGLPGHIPPHIQGASFAGYHENTSSAASSPSAAYAGLSLEGERRGDSQGPCLRKSSLAPNEADTRGQSPAQFPSHRAIMGGASEQSQRSSSPLKRRASELEPEVTSSQDDVDMIAVPSTDPAPVDDISKPTLSPRPKSPQTVDMLQEEEAQTQHVEVGNDTETRSSAITGEEPSSSCY